MDLPAAPAVLGHSRRRRRLLLLLAAAGLAGYGAYRAYHHPAVAEKRRKLVELLRSLASLSRALTNSAEAISLVSSDLNRFLASDSNEIPNSLRQMSKIARSEDFAAALSQVSEAVTVGMIRGAKVGAFSESKAGSCEGPDGADRILDKVFSPAGMGFMSVVAGSFARNLVMGFYDSDGGSDGEARLVPEWVKIACSDKVKELMGECIQTFVGTAVEVYLKKTMDVNTYDEMFSGLTNPKHGEKMKEVLVTVCNGAVETLVKTSHEVLTSSKPSSSPITGECNEEEAEFPPDQRKKDMPSDSNSSSGGGGWLSGVSSSLAVPSNRRFVLDVTGRVTFETVKSVLDFMFWKTYDSARSGVRVVSQGMFEKGMEVIRYVSAKSMLILTICFSMLLHLAFGSRLLVTA